MRVVPIVRYRTPSMPVEHSAMKRQGALVPFVLGMLVSGLIVIAALAMVRH